MIKMKKKVWSIFLVAGMSFCLSPVLLGKDRLRKKEAPEVKEEKDTAIDEKGTEDVEKKKTIPQVTKGMKTLAGFYTLYQKDEKLYCLIKADQLKKPFLLAMTLTLGINAGTQWDHMPVYWNLQGKKLLLLRPDLRYQGGESTLESAVSRTHPATILRSVPLLSRNDEGDCLVDFSPLFKSDLAGLTPQLKDLAGVEGELNSELSQWKKIKVFPQNVEIEVDLAFTGVRVAGESPNPTDFTDKGRHYRQGVHYSLSQLPVTTYLPRQADSRVGYFTTAVKDFSRPYGSRSNFQRYIERWHLEKADPTVKLSPPKKPIVFYLDKAIPYRFRRYVKQGVLDWNKAFEKIGFSDALVVRQQTETDFADLDPADVRYNFIVWTTSDEGYAFGPSRVNPMTGQILDADITYDDSMLRFATGEARVLGSQAGKFGGDPKLEFFLKNLPGFGKAKKDLYPWDKKISLRDRARTRLFSRLKRQGRPFCTHARGLRHQLFLGILALRAAGAKTIPDELFGSSVRETIMHEVGHTLGLYHNFKGSSYLSIKEINSKEKPGATSGSVMDYNGTNFAPPGIPQGFYLPQTIGPYDYWAIEYGYRIPDKDQTEEDMLGSIAKKGSEKGLGYGNDQFSSLTDPDPHIVMWDLGSDHVEFGRQRIQLVEHILKNLPDRMVRQGENYFPVRQAFGTLLREYGYSLYLIARYIGGVNLSWSHKGDPLGAPPIQVIPAARQKEALTFLQKTVFSEKGLVIPREVLPYLSPGTQWHWGSDEFSTRATYPVKESWLEIQKSVLAILLNPANLWRLHNLPSHVSEKEEVFTLQDLFDGLTKSVWSELKKDPLKEKPGRRKPFISASRRNLQRQYLAIWMDYFVMDRGTVSIPEDAKTLARRNLMALDEALKKVLSRKGLDGLSQAHLAECREKIEKALKAVYVK